MKFDKKTAVRLAKASLWAYDFDESREVELLKFKSKLHIRDMKISDKRTVPTSFVGIVECPDVIIVAFQGTITEFGRDGVFRFDTLIDWMQNFEIKLLDKSKTSLPGKVHHGFFQQLELVYDQVTSALKTIAGRKPILVTGHSQGGAVAVLATKLLHQDGFPVKATYTFAAPRCGDAVFAKSVKTPVHRIEFGHDVVPHLPPLLSQKSILGTAIVALNKLFDLPDAIVALGQLASKTKKSHSYRSIGKLTYRDEETNLQTELTTSQEKSLFTERKRRLIKAGKSLVRHHGLENYIGMFS